VFVFGVGLIFLEVEFFFADDLLDFPAAHAGRHIIFVSHHLYYALSKN